MSITSLSLTFFSFSGAAPAPAPVAGASPAANDPVAMPSQACGSSGHGHGRRNVLYEAMMAALREMGLTPDPAPAAPVQGVRSPLPPAPATPAAATPAPPVVAVPPMQSPAATGVVAALAVDPATPPAASVEDVVFEFAHALWQAVRGGERSESGRRHHDGDDREGRHRHHGHHGHHGDREGFGVSRGYSGLATRLESLAVRHDSGAAAVNAAAVVPAAQAATPTESAAVPAIQTPVAPAPASALSQAFDAMMSVLRSLNPSAPSADSASPTLASFLHSLARGLGADRATPALSGVGIVINISA